MSGLLTYSQNWISGELRIAFVSERDNLLEPYGHAEYLVMPFGLTNAPERIQHLINDVLQDLLDQFLVVYLVWEDQYIIYLDQNATHVHTVLERL